MFGGQFSDAAIETRVFQLSLLMIGCRDGQRRNRLSPHILEMYFVCNTIKITRRFARVRSLNFGKFARDAVDRFVSQVFGFRTAATSEYLDESEANSLVLQRGRFAIWIKPGE